MNKHTAGKWVAESDGEYWNVIVEGGQAFGREIVGCEGLYRCDGSDEANARLIAAAPELLWALADLLDVYRRGAQGFPLTYELCKVIEEQAANAIAKATGEA